MKIVIIGCGLVGTATAVALQKAGHQCMIFDKFDPATTTAGGKVQFGETGGSVILAPNSFHFLEEIGVFDDFYAASWPSTRTIYHKIDGSSPIVFETEKLTSRVETKERFRSPRQILRSKLHNIFGSAAAAAGAKIFAKSQAIGVEDTGSGVTVHFEDGNKAEGDLLIGADGIHSVIRRKVFGEHLKAKFTGAVGYIAVINCKETGVNVNETAVFYTDRTNKREVVVLKAAEDMVTMHLGSTSNVEGQQESYEAVNDLPNKTSELADVLSSWGVPKYCVTMLRGAQRILPHNVYDLDDMPEFHKGRVILIGDAAHGMLPNAGLGLGTGFDDVAVLIELCKQTTVDSTDAAIDALGRRYSEIRVPRAHKNSSTSRNMAKQAYATVPIFGATGGHALLRTFIWMVNSDWVRPFKGAEDYAKVVAALQ
ncbi:hypothetical protein HDU82_005271 [Entophlyctis luteolus]|nr:hypothetical protein HDU82_005271 [Entophlyctis luteolus]